MKHTTIAAVLDDLFGHPRAPLDEILDKHYSPDFRQRTNGTWLDRESFAAHHAMLREQVAHAEVAVADELVDGNAYAERHTVSVTTLDGTEICTEVYLFGQFADDGRFQWIDEVVVPLPTRST
ncbi:nuclear transport factor 2 family protein [Mycobacterium syngnathidarum]